MSFWSEKWGYKQSILIICTLIINGFLIEIFAFDRGISAPPYPVNIIYFSLFSIIGILISWYRPLKKIKKWLISKPFIITLITFFSVLIMLSGYIPQRPFFNHPILQSLGIFNITTSIPFILLMTLITLSLFLASINKLFPFKSKNIPFLLNHIGILVIICAGIVGSSEVKKVHLKLEQGETIWQGYITDKPSIKLEMPFALKLHEFILEEYPPELAIVDNKDTIVFKCGRLNSKASGQLCQFKDYSINIKEFIPDGFKVEDKFVSVDHIGTSPIAKIDVIKKNEFKTGTVVRGSSLTQTEYLRINSDYRVAIPPQKPKNFKSVGNFYTPQGTIDKFSIEVNKPFEINGWKLYQYGYNESMGKWSKTSTIEAVYDPSINIIYIGSILLIIGSLFLMFPSKYTERGLK